MTPYIKGRLKMYSFKWGPHMEYEGQLPRIIAVSVAVAISSAGLSAILFAVAQLIRALTGH